jgi:calcium-dependent protein kinase
MLKHPNILEFVEAFESQYELVIVTQYLSGGEMFDRLQTLHHYDEKTAAKLAKKMLQALYYCHKHDIVHRDLKPENYCFVNESEDSGLIWSLCLFWCLSCIIVCMCCVFKQN